MGAPQTSYALNNPAAAPGMLYDHDDSNFIDSKPCGATSIGFGIGVELVNGVLQPAKGTGDPDSNVFWGVTVFKDSQEPGGYVQGDEVPVLRRGRIAAQLDTGVTATAGTVARLSHSSTTAAKQGIFTSAAASGTAGSEVSDVGAKFYKDVGLTAGTPPLAIIELNLP